MQMTKSAAANSVFQMDLCLEFWARLFDPNQGLNSQPEPTLQNKDRKARLQNESIKPTLQRLEYNRLQDGRGLVHLDEVTNHAYCM